MREIIDEHTFRYRLEGRLIDVRHMATVEGLSSHMLEEALSSDLVPEHYKTLDDARRAYDADEVLPGTDEARKALQGMALFYTTEDEARATVVHKADFSWNRRGSKRAPAAASFLARR